MIIQCDSQFYQILENLTAVPNQQKFVKMLTEWTIVADYVTVQQRTMDRFYKERDAKTSEAVRPKERTASGTPCTHGT